MLGLLPRSRYRSGRTGLASGAPLLTGGFPGVPGIYQLRGRDGHSMGTGRMCIYAGIVPSAAWLRSRYTAGCAVALATFSMSCQDAMHSVIRMVPEIRTAQRTIHCSHEHTILPLPGIRYQVRRSAYPLPGPS